MKTRKILTSNCCRNISLVSPSTCTKWSWPKGNSGMLWQCCGCRGSPAR